MSIFRCDWKDKDGFQCGRKPYMEIYPLKIKDDETGEVEEEHIEGWDFTFPKFEGGWSYLCLRHYLLAKLKGHKFCCCRVDSDREAIEDIKDMLWDISGEIYAIKEKLGIKNPDIEELEKLLEEDEKE